MTVTDSPGLDLWLSRSYPRSGLPQKGTFLSFPAQFSSAQSKREGEGMGLAVQRWCLTTTAAQSRVTLLASITGGPGAQMRDDGVFRSLKAVDTQGSDKLGEKHAV